MPVQISKLLFPVYQFYFFYYPIRTSMFIIQLHLISVFVVVVLMVGPISTAAMRAYCTLTPPSGVSSFISRGAEHQAA
jgi:hypothetical protein